MLRAYRGALSRFERLFLATPLSVLAGWEVVLLLSNGSGAFVATLAAAHAVPPRAGGGGYYAMTYVFACGILMIGAGGDSSCAVTPNCLPGSRSPLRVICGIHTPPQV